MSRRSVKAASGILEKERGKRRRELIESMYRPFRAVKIRVRRLGSATPGAQNLVQAVELAMDAAMAQIDDLVEEFSPELDACVDESETLVAPLKKKLQDSTEQLRVEGSPKILASLVQVLTTCQKIRIALENKCQTLTDNRARFAATSGPLASLTVQFSLLEEELLSHVARELARHAAGEFLAGVRGLGPLTAGRVVGLIPMYESSSFTTFSKLRTYAGFAPGRDKHVKNVRSHFNTNLRTALHVCWATWVKLYRQGKLDAQGHYLDIYLKWEQQYAQTRRDWNKLHQTLAARRKCLDVFLHHVWHQWRTKEGWPVRELYVHERLNHEMIYKPQEFWDPDLAQKNLKQWAAGKIH